MRRTTKTKLASEEDGWEDDKNGEEDVKDNGDGEKDNEQEQEPEPEFVWRWSQKCQNW